METVDTIKDKPFAADVLKKANKIAGQYHIVLVQEDGQWVGNALEYPEAIGTGTTPEECIAATREMAVSGIATMLELGEKPPVAARPGIRSQQANIRMTLEEKAQLEAAARHKGFRGLSDFIRAAALDFAR